MIYRTSTIRFLFLLETSQDRAAVYSLLTRQMVK